MLPILSAASFMLAVLLMIKRSKWRRTQAVLMLIAGLSLAGGAAGVRGRLTALGTDTTMSMTSRVLGVGLAFGFAMVIVVWWSLDMDLDGLVNKLRKKGGGSGKHGTTAMTPWLSLFVPPMLAALPFVGALSPQLTAFGNDLATVLFGA